MFDRRHFSLITLTPTLKIASKLENARVATAQNDPDEVLIRNGREEREGQLRETANVNQRAPLGYESATSTLGLINERWTIDLCLFHPFENMFSSFAF